MTDWNGNGKSDDSDKFMDYTLFNECMKDEKDQADPAQGQVSPAGSGTGCGGFIALVTLALCLITALLCCHA